LGLGFFSSEGLRPTRGGIELIEGYVAAAFIAVGFTTFYFVSSTDVNGNITGGWLGGQLQKPIPGYKRNLAQRRYRQNDLDPAVLVSTQPTSVPRTYNSISAGHLIFIAPLLNVDRSFSLRPLLQAFCHSGS